MARYSEEELRLLRGIIKYHEGLILQAKFLSMPSIQALEEGTVRFLKGLVGENVKPRQ